MSSQDFAYEAFTLFGCTSLYILLSLLTLLTVLQPRISPVWAFSPFARRYSGNHCCFLFLRVLRCFSSPGSSPFSGMTASRLPGSPIRIPTVLCLLTAGRRISLFGASFFSTVWPGILPAPFLA